MRLSVLLRDVPIEKTNIADFSATVTALTDHCDRVERGGVFVCVSGIRHDGHDYIERAVLCGAAVIVVERMTDALRAGGVPYVLTRDTRQALALMWSAWYGNPGRDLRLYAVTGTNGKSSTCAVLRSVLTAAGLPTGLIGSIRNEFAGRELPGNPMTTPAPELLFSLLASMRDMGARAVVMEASSHALALGRLCGLTFDAGVFTNLSPEHLDFHPTMQDYAAAKARLFAQCRVGLLNYDDPYTAQILPSCTCPVRTYSVGGSADYIAKEVEYPEGGGIEYLLLTRRELFRVASPLVGRFSVYNTLAAASAAYETGIPSAQIARGIAELSVIDGRMEPVVREPFAVYIDYAHTPVALEQAITEVARITPGRVITVFGCGGERDRGKRSLMGRVATALSALTVITTDNPRGEDPDAIIADILTGVDGGQMTVVRDREAAIAYALSAVSPGDAVLIAGKGHETYQILSDGMHPFSEREIVLKILDKKATER